MKYDLTALDSIDMPAKELNKKSKRWLIAALELIKLNRKQAVTDHAMELENLRQQLETEKKSADFWRAEANKAAATASKTEVELRQSRAFVTKLGGAVAKLGDSIAHL